MTRRTYGQYCGLAKAMDIIGERWTALIIRNLAVQPVRFTDLLSALPGLGTSLLSERLRHLEDAGLVERAAVERSAGGGVTYRLTGEGLRVARALAPLTAWGATRLEDPPDEQFRPEWLMFSLESLVDASASDDVRACYELVVDGVAFWVLVEDGRVRVTQDKPRDPDFVAAMQLRTLGELRAGVVTPAEAVASGALEFSGDQDAAEHALRLFGVAG